LALYLNNCIDKATMELQEREDTVQLVHSALLIRPGNGKRLVAACYASRGSGKTQLVRCFLASKRSEAVMCGRVIVRCCEKAHHSNEKWMQQVQEGNVYDGFCELIRTHVLSVTGIAQDPSHYRNPIEVYQTWISETSKHYGIGADRTDVNPLIALDTCEIIASVVDKTRRHATSGKPHTLLESLCLAVPPPHGIFVIGCNATISTDALFLTCAR
jgi:ABC-type dipeptide/oligopeptide/nickel transport system ATPase subunit